MFPHFVAPGRQSRSLQAIQAREALQIRPAARIPQRLPDGWNAECRPMQKRSVSLPQKPRDALRVGAFPQSRVHQRTESRVTV